ncbi:MAG TPA: serine hydroxymethyltransferase [Thermoplasmata archaeon]|nr:serine hydroxymethyltransferase [Thermoplasmata archaeon]
MMRAQEKWRLEDSINLLPSENMSSPQVRALLSSDFGHRYTLPVNAEYAGEFLENSYRGTKLTTDVELKAEEVAKEVFKAKHACVQPMGGHIAALIAIVSTTKRGDTLCAIPPENGGYDGYGQAYIPDILGLKSLRLPFDMDAYNLDIEASTKMITSKKPKLVILGASFILFPYDMRPVKEACEDVSATLIYDGSHVLGLIAGGEFQKPLKEGGDILYGSTHKSFFGPQGGLILTNGDAMDSEIRKNLTWRIVDNIHWNRVAALGQALLEMKKFGPAYAKQVVKNAKRLGKDLKDRGVPIMFEDLGFTQSHQLLMDSKEIRAIYGVSVNDFSIRLEKSNLIIDSVSRLGVAEVTRLGMKEKHMADVADLFVAAAQGKKVGRQVKQLRDQFGMDFRFR